MDPDAKTGGSTQPGGRLLHRVRLPATVLLFLILALAAYYLLYAQKKATYLVGRNFRLLETMGESVRESTLSYGKVLESNGTERTEEVTGLSPVGRCDSARKRTDGLPNIWWEETHAVLNIAAFPLGVDPVCASLDPKALFPSLFESRGIFDGVLLARKTGAVVYVHGVQDLGITQLGPLLAKNALKDQKISKDGSTQDDSSPLRAAAGYHNVEIGGRPYKLFIEPVSLPIGMKPGDQGETWLLCGLVAADEFVYKTMAIPSSTLLLILTVLLLAALSWPLVRLRLIGERQRVRVIDVLLLGMCTLLGVAILTLSLVDFYAYAELQNISRTQIQRFATTMAENLAHEIKAAHSTITQLQSQYPFLRPANDPDTWKDFALVGKDGNQLFKVDSHGKRLPGILVKDRPYFQHAFKDDIWTLPSGAGPFYLQFVTARTTHEQEAVLAEKVKREVLGQRGFAVATLAIPMHSVIDPNTPPGFEFAVIDDLGQVLFHSNSARNGVENFFTEADGNQRLRSAVFARREETLGIRYFGEDYMASLKPIEGLPWTVVALRSQEQLRALNMEWVVATVLFLLLAAGPLAVFVLAIALTRRGYRAPWLWPNSARTADYLSLAVLLVLYSLIFGIAMNRLPEAGPLLGIAWTLPFFTLLASYVRLQVKATPWSVRQIGVGTTCLALFCILLWTLFFLSPVHPQPGKTFHEPILTGLIAALLLVSLAMGDWHPIGKRWPNRFQVPVTFAYPLVGFLLMMTTVVLPTVGIFKVVHRIELFSFIRFGQLKLARGTGKTASEVGFYGASFFDTQRVDGKENGVCRCSKDEKIAEDSPLPEFLEGLLPHYSLHTAQMRELLHNRAGDCSWDVHSVSDRYMELHSRGQNLNLRSHFKDLFSGAASQMKMAGFFVPPSNASIAIGTVLSFGLVLLFFTILFWLSQFISQRLFMVDLMEPVWSARDDALAPITGRNLFVVQKEPISDNKATDLGLLPFHLTGKQTDEDLENLFQTIIVSDENILLDGFERKILESKFNAWMLKLLDILVEQRQRTVVVLSEVSPARLLARARRKAGPDAATLLQSENSWREVLSSFTVIEEDLRVRLAPNGRNPSLWSRMLGMLSQTKCAEMPLILREESVNDSFLIRIAEGMTTISRKMDSEQLLEEFGERAEGYYRTLWESCSDDERVVLQHLAEDGLVNPKNRRGIRRLMARRLIRRAPHFCLMNESFRRFVSSPACRCEVQTLEHDAVPSAWDRFQWPFLATVSACLIFFFATQQELLDSTLAVVTGLTAGLPTVTKLVDFLGGRRPAVSK